MYISPPCVFSSVYKSPRVCLFHVYVPLCVYSLCVYVPLHLYVLSICITPPWVCLLSYIFFLCVYPLHVHIPFACISLLYNIPSEWCPLRVVSLHMMSPSCGVPSVWSPPCVCFFNWLFLHVYVSLCVRYSFCVFLPYVYPSMLMSFLCASPFVRIFLLMIVVGICIP